MSQLLALKHLTPAAAGKQRYVYRHPQDSTLLVKVPRESYVLEKSGVGGRWYKPLTRYRHALVFLRELREHLAVRAVSERMPRHMQEIVGFVETDMGMGLVSRAILGSDGELAPNLRDLVLQGRFTPAMRGDLQVFIDWMLASPVILGDLHIGNLVYGHDPRHGDYFAVIDGIGEKTLVPVMSMSRRINRMAKRRRIARLNRQIEIFAARAAAGALPTARPMR